MTKEYLAWLRELIAQNRLDKFYHSAEWVKTAAKVARLDNYECQVCKRAGRVTAKGMTGPDGIPVQLSAHHRREVKRYPQLALSIFYTDETGRRRRNIEYVCESCHNHIHHKFEMQKSKFTNQEWW